LLAGPVVAALLFAALVCLLRYHPTPWITTAYASFVIALGVILYFVNRARYIARW